MSNIGSRITAFPARDSPNRVWLLRIPFGSGIENPFEPHIPRGVTNHVTWNSHRFPRCHAINILLLRPTVRLVCKELPENNFGTSLVRCISIRILWDTWDTFSIFYEHGLVTEARYRCNFAGKLEIMAQNVFTAFVYLEAFIGGRFWKVLKQAFHRVFNQN